MKKIEFDKIKIGVGSKGSLIIGVVLFVVAFAVTTLILHSGTNVKIDMFEFGKGIREITDGENGDIVLEINDNKYYEKDLKLIIESFKISDPQYMKLKEDQIRNVAAAQLIQQKLLLIEFTNLELVVTADELDKYIDTQKEAIDKAIAQKDTSADEMLQYIAGYGCKYSEFWNEPSVRNTYLEELKMTKVQRAICDKAGSKTIRKSVVMTYLNDKMKSEEYKIILFGEEYKG